MGEYRLLIRLTVLGVGERIFLAPLTMESVEHHRLQRRDRAHGFAAHR
jgi:hypothetical protein